MRLIVFISFLCILSVFNRFICFETSQITAMITDVQVDECCDYFLKNHIVIREDWLKAALNYIIQKFPTYTGRRLYNLLFQQWLYSNLKDSCHSSLDLIDARERKCDVQLPLVLQITSLVDIGSSLLSQFNKLTYEFVDNSGFDIDPSEQKDDNLYQAKPSRCLMLTLSDGEKELKGMERRPIPSLSLLTAPGCKVVLYPPLVCRKGVFLLNSNNIQILGGDDCELMEIGRPLNVMARTLNKEIPKKRDFSHLNSNPDEIVDEDQLIAEWEAEEEQFDMADFDPLPTTSSTPVISTPSVPSSTPTPRPPPRSIASSFTPSTPIHSYSSTRMRNTQSTSSTMSSLHISSPVMERKREIKREMEEIEVIDLDDDSVPSTSTALNVNSKDESGREVTHGVDEKDQFVIAYRSLRLITLQEATKQSKYLTGGIKRKVEAFVDTFVEALRIVDDLWTMKIRLQDESAEVVECVIHSSVLERLIGLTVEEAMTIRTSSDMERKQEGMRKLAATEDTLSRLDLIWTIQFFPTSHMASPVVHDVQSLAEILNAFD